MPSGIRRSSVPDDFVMPSSGNASSIDATGRTAVPGAVMNEDSRLARRPRAASTSAASRSGPPRGTQARVSAQDRHVTPSSGVRARVECQLEDEGPIQLLDGTLQTQGPSSIFRPDTPTGAPGPRLHNVKLPDGTDLYVRAVRGGATDDKTPAQIAADLVRSSLSDDGRELNLGSVSAPVLDPGVYDALDWSEIKDDVARVETVRIDIAANGVTRIPPLLKLPRLRRLQVRIRNGDCDFERLRAEAALGHGAALEVLDVQRTGSSGWMPDDPKVPIEVLRLPALCSVGLAPEILPPGDKTTGLFGPALKHLTLLNTNASSEARFPLRALTSAMPTIESLHLPGCEWHADVLDKFAKALKEHALTLKSLTLTGNKFGSDAVSRHLFRIPTLETLDLSGSDYSLEDLAQAAASAKKGKVVGSLLSSSADDGFGCALKTLSLARRPKYLRNVNNPNYRPPSKLKVERIYGRTVAGHPLPPKMIKALSERNDWAHLGDLLRDLPHLETLDLTRNFVALNPLAEALASEPGLGANVSRFVLTDCLLDRVPPEILRLGPEPEDLKTVGLGLTELYTLRSARARKLVRFDVQDDDLQSDDPLRGGSVAPHGKRPDMGRAMTLTTVGTGRLDDKNLTIYHIQRDIIEQLDHIYGSPQVARYYEMAKLAFITLLEGAQVLRTGVRPYDSAIKPGMAQSAPAQALKMVGPASSAAALLLGAVIPPAVQAVPVVGSVLEFVFTQHAGREYAKTNEQMARMLDISGNNIRLFADTMARAMALMHEGDLIASQQDMDGRFWQAMKSAAGTKFNRMLEWAAGRSKGENVEETSIRLLATQHVTEIVMNIAGGEKVLAGMLQQAVDKAGSRPYETDQLKVLPALEWHAGKHLVSSVSPQDLSDCIVWGELEGVMTKATLDAKIKAKRERRLHTERSDSPSSPTSFSGFDDSRSIGSGKSVDDTPSTVDAMIQRSISEAVLELVDDLDETKARVNPLEAELARMKLDNAQIKQENAQIKLENTQIKLENTQIKLVNEQFKEEIATLKRDGAATDLAITALQTTLNILLQGTQTTPQPCTSEDDLPPDGGLVATRDENSVETQRAPFDAPNSTANPGSAEPLVRPAADVAPPSSPSRALNERSTPAGRRSILRSQLDMDLYDLDRMTRLLTELVTTLHAKQEASTRPDDPLGGADRRPPLQNVVFLDGLPMIRERTSSLLATVARQPRTQWVPVGDFLRGNHRRSNAPYTFPRDLDRALKHLGISAEDPDLLDIGQRFRQELHATSTTGAGSPKAGATRERAIPDGGHPSISFHQRGDDGRFPFHHEKQSGTDCGVHALNTFNHGRDLMTPERFAEAAAQARLRMARWGQDIPEAQARASGTGMADLAHVSVHELGRQIRYLQTELGSQAGMDGAITASFKTLRDAFILGNVRRNIQAVEDEVRRTWNEIRAVAPAEQAAMTQTAIAHCQALAASLLPRADEMRVSGKDRLGPRLRDAIDGIFNRLLALQSHRESFLEAVLDVDRIANGKVRGELLLQMGRRIGNSRAKMAEAGLGHHLTLRWDEANGDCYVVDSQLDTQRKLEGREGLSEFLEDCEGLEFIIPDEADDPLLALLHPEGGEARRQTGMHDAGQGIGIGPHAWPTLNDRLDLALDEAHLAEVEAAEKAFGGDGEAAGILGSAGRGFSGWLTRSGGGAAASRLDAALKPMRAIDALLESVCEDKALLQMHPLEAGTALTVMGAALDEAANRFGAQSVAMGPLIARMQYRLAQMREALEPETSVGEIEEPVVALDSTVVSETRGDTRSPSPIVPSAEAEPSTGAPSNDQDA